MIDKLIDLKMKNERNIITNNISGTKYESVDRSTHNYLNEPVNTLVMSRVQKMLDDFEINVPKEVLNSFETISDLYNFSNKMVDKKMQEYANETY